MNKTEQQHIINECIRKGDWYYEMGRYHEALETYTQGIRIQKDNLVLNTKKANMLTRLNKKTDAFYDYLSVFVKARVLDLIDNFIEQGLVYTHQDTQALMDLLCIKYEIPISKEGLELVLRTLQSEFEEKQQRKEWKQFIKKIQRKQIQQLDIIVEEFLKTFGERYLFHFFDLFCYVWKYKGYDITTSQLIDVIIKQRTLMRVNQFEHLLRTGGLKKGKTLDRMTGIEFEEYLITLFESMGYHVERTLKSHDQGADLVISKFGERIAIQAKRRRRLIGVTAIQEVITGQQVHHAHRALVITTSSFTTPAMTLAKRLGVELWNRKRLLEEIHKYRL